MVPEVNLKDGPQDELLLGSNEMMRKTHWYQSTMSTVKENEAIKKQNRKEK